MADPLDVIEESIPPPDQEVTVAADVTAEEPTAADTEETDPLASIELSIEQVPELAGKVVGDTIMLSIREVAGDGNMYTLIPAGENEAPLEAPLSPDQAQSDVAKALLGGGPGA